MAELDGTTGGRLLALSHHDKRYASEAVERIGRALALRQAGHLRSGALDQIGLAEARLVQGEYGEAAHLCDAAVASAEQTQFHRVRVKLAELYETSASRAAVPTVAGLRLRIRSVLDARPA